MQLSRGKFQKCWILLAKNQIKCFSSVWWGRVGINSPLFSIQEFSTDLKRIQSPHRLFQGFRADKPLQPIGQAAEFKFESKFKPLQIIWQSLPKSRRQFKALTAKSMAELLGQCSSTAWPEQVRRVSTITGCIRVYGSCCWP